MNEIYLILMRAHTCRRCQSSGWMEACSAPFRARVALSIILTHKPYPALHYDTLLVIAILYQIIAFGDILGDWDWGYRMFSDLAMAANVQGIRRKCK